MLTRTAHFFERHRLATALAVCLGAAGCRARTDPDIPRLTPQSPDARLSWTGVTFTGDWSYVEGASRWMGRQAQLVLPNRRWSDMHLLLNAWVPSAALGHRPTIVLRIDDWELDRFEADGPIAKDYVVPSSKRSGRTTTLTISTSETLHANDGRDLGLALGWFVWEPNVAQP